jgi:hypothetical protein
MSKLKDEFVKTVKNIEGEDATNYRTWRLKERLCERFPQLVFHTPKVRNSSEIVYVEDLSCGTVAEKILTSTEQSDHEWEMTEDEEEEGVDIMEEKQIDRRVPLKDLYLVALELRENIRSYHETWYQNWPPVASDITGESVRKVVSPILFNFISWVLGYSDDPEESEYADTGEECAVKVFSICQDLVYNSSRGKTQTPKALSLAMAVRQISGCSELVRILNGLGHCVSLSSTMAYDTAIAQLTIQTSNILPREFVANEATNLVYDNIDFGEDIKKQTHVTNGIITQKITSDGQSTSTGQTPKISKSQRSLKATVPDVMPFSIGVKKTPKFEEVTRQVTITTTSRDAARKLDFAYVLVKMVPSEDCVLPGWTGFNTLLCQYDIPQVSRVGYLPVIDASPTEYSTINTILKRSQAIADQLQLRYATLVFDEAVYAKVQHVRWKNDVFYNRFVVRLGEFHAIMSFLSAISKIFVDGGLKVYSISRSFAYEHTVRYT